MVENESFDLEEIGSQTVQVADETSIGWRNLRYETEQWFGRRRKVILNRLNGCFDYHTLNAFMGPSGAGKTTLLNCLNGNRVKGMTPESEIYLNKDQRGGKVVSYFIEQHVEKTIVGRMRVGQILRYAYRFKNGNEGDMEGHIRKTIDELLLDELVLNRNFGQCSGGEQKRVAIAQELMSLQKPTLLFVDEPTTGLDSNAAYLVMKCLRQLATNHRMAIITSIHVPSDDILTLFDKLYVLAKGGVCIYSGRPDQLRSHLETKIESLVIPEEQPPIEALTKIACSGITDPQVVTLAKHTLSAEYNDITQRLPKLELYPHGVPNHRERFRFFHFYLQTIRMFQITFISSYKLILLQLIAGISVLIFTTSLFGSDMVKPSGCYPLSLDEQSSNSTCADQIESDSGIGRSLKFHGACIDYNAFILLCMSTFLYGPIVKVFQNEHRNRWYSLGVFFWSSTIVSFIQASLYISVYAILSYFYSNQNYSDNYKLNWNRIGYYLYFIEIFAIYIDSLGQLIAAILLTNIELCMIVVIVFSVIITLFSGTFIEVQTTGSILITGIKNVVAINPIFKGMLYTFYGLDRCDLDTEYSLVLVKHFVEPNKIWDYSRPVLTNAALIRIFTLAYMYWRFNWSGKSSVRKSPSKEEAAMISIQFDTNDLKSANQINCHNKLLLITKREKPKDEIDFEKFSRGKIIVAWRNLSLFGTSLLFEQISTTEAEEGPVDKGILKNMNGELRFGTLNAVMGTSGAGKTSLLKVLNGRDKTRLSPQSQFYLSKFTRIQTCFITQDVSGHLLPGLTAKQMLVYASRLKNAQLRECGVDTSQIDHQQIALNLLDELGLSDTVDTPVEKCSGGERKRLALALELTALQMPNLICIDEPTSGLDSNSAEVVVACLRKLTQTHSITIVTSIHQPNTGVLLMFDQIYVLARGGVCVYSGCPTSILSHLQTVPKISLTSKFPIEDLIKLSCRTFPDPTVQHLVSSNNSLFNQTIVSSGLLEEETQLVTDGIQQNRRRFSLEDTWVLCARYLSYLCKHLWKEWTVYIVVYFGFALFMMHLFDPEMATVSGCLDPEDDFNNTCAKTEEKIHDENLLSYNLQFITFSFCYFLIFVLIQSGLSFFGDSVYFVNEHRNGWYSSGSFYLTKSLFDSVPILVVILIFVYICDIYESTIPGIYFQLVLVLSLASFAYQGLAHLVSIISNGQIMILAILGCSVFFSNFLISNFFVPVTSLHYTFQILTKISISGYLLDSIILLQYGFGRCLPKQIQPLLYLFSLDDSDYRSNLIALILLILFFHITSIVLLVRSVSPGQNRRHRIQRITDYVSKLRPTNAAIPGIGSANEFRIRLIRF